MKINFKKLLRKKNKADDSLTAKSGPVNFNRDWKILIIIFAVGMISLSLFAWKIYLSDKIAGGYLVPPLPVSDLSVETVDVKKLQTNLTILENKQTDFIQYKSTRPKLVDPSF